MPGQGPQHHSAHLSLAMLLLKVTLHLVRIPCLPGASESQGTAPPVTAQGRHPREARRLQGWEGRWHGGWAVVLQVQLSNEAVSVSQSCELQ